MLLHSFNCCKEVILGNTGLILKTEVNVCPIILIFLYNIINTFLVSHEFLREFTSFISCISHFLIKAIIVVVKHLSLQETIIVFQIYIVKSSDNVKSWDWVLHFHKADLVIRVLRNSNIQDFPISATQFMNLFLCEMRES